MTPSTNDTGYPSRQAELCETRSREVAPRAQGFPLPENPFLESSRESQITGSWMRRTRARRACNQEDSGPRDGPCKQHQTRAREAAAPAPRLPVDVDAINFQLALAVSRRDDSGERKLWPLFLRSVSSAAGTRRTV